MEAGFRDRRDAGRQLASALTRVVGGEDVLVLALPRGGVPVAAEVARVLGVSLDLWLVRKLGVPGHEELAMGAIAFGGECHLNDEEIRAFGVAQADIDWAILQETDHLERMNRRYRKGAAAPDVVGRSVVVIDDGIATGATMRAAVASLRKAGAQRVVVAAPVCSVQSHKELSHDADALVTLLTPEPFFAVGQWYDDFTPTTDDEVLEALRAPSS